MKRHYLGLSASIILTLVLINSTFFASAGQKLKIPVIPCTDPRGCPDLVVDGSQLSQGGIVKKTFTSTDCEVVEWGQATGTRYLFTFTSATPNVGKGDLTIGNVTNWPQIFYFSPCHNHYHMRNYTAYRLWTPQGYQEWQALRAANPDALPDDILAAHPELSSQLVVGKKFAYCIIDFYPLPGTTKPGKYNDCIANQGISVGWADAYFWFFHGQYIDVTGLPPGNYILEDEVNPNHYLQESNYTNNAAAITITLTNRVK